MGIESGTKAEEECDLIATDFKLEYSLLNI